MKKVIILTISMLAVNSKIFSVQDELESAKNRVYGSVQRLSQQQQRRSMLEAEIKQAQDSLTQIQGNPEYAADYEKRQEEIRNLIHQYNNIVDECKSSIDHMGKELHNVSSRYYVTGENGKYDVSKPSYKKPSPIVHKPSAYVNKFSDYSK